MITPRLKRLMGAALVLLILSCCLWWASGGSAELPKAAAGPQARTQDEPEPVPQRS